MHIKANDLVLEIGSGDNPHPRSNILCDRYLNKNIERAGGFSIRIDRPFVVCDGYKLPFADGSFDYVICSHILEHMRSPEKFLAEVMRVGKAGYFEVPTALSERVFGWRFHHWYIEKIGRQLVIRPKSHGERWGGFFHHLIANTWFRRFFEAHDSLFYLRVEWSTTSPLEILRAKPTSAWLNNLDTRIDQLLGRVTPDLISDMQFYVSWIMRRIKNKFRKEFRYLLWRIRVLLFPMGIIDGLRERLRCIFCKERLNRNHNKLKCTYCGRVYTLDGVIPILL